MAWQDFPMITCPHCGKESQIDDYYDLGAGESFFCPKCNQEIYVWAIDVVKSGDFHTVPEI